MAYQCPRCGEKVSRSARSGCLFGGGLVGAMLSAALMLKSLLMQNSPG